MNVVDSSGWLEYVAGGANAGFFAKAIEATEDLVVPTLSVYEVFKRVLQQRGEGDALQVIAAMHQGRVVELSSTLALDAARLSANCGCRWPIASCSRPPAPTTRRCGHRSGVSQAFLV